MCGEMRALYGSRGRRGARWGSRSYNSKSLDFVIQVFGTVFVLDALSI